MSCSRSRSPTRTRRNAATRAAQSVLFPSWLRPSASSVGVWPVVAAAVTAAMTGSHSVRRGGRVLRGLVGQGCRGGQQVGQGLIGGVGVGAQGGDEVTEADAVAGVD